MKDAEREYHLTRKALDDAVNNFVEARHYRRVLDERDFFRPSPRDVYIDYDKGNASYIMGQLETVARRKADIARDTLAIRKMDTVLEAAKVAMKDREQAFFCAATKRESAYMCVHGPRFYLDERFNPYK
jgi:hypothetical protein